MQTFKKENFYGMNVQIVERTEDCAVYQMHSSEGSGVMTTFSVFPGIELIYNDFHMPSCFQDVPPASDILEINHCREGRFECAFENGSCVYMEEGDLAVNLRSTRAVTSNFPLAHYHGVAVMISLNKAGATVSSVLEDISIDLPALCRRLRLEQRCFIMRAKAEIQHIFSELYNIPKEVQKGYFKLKVLEILLFLSATDVSECNDAKKYFPKKQVDTVKEIKKYITENMDQRYTLEELSQKFGIGLTFMKQCFKGVFGASILSYLKAYRMQAAALMLRKSNESITEIAGKVGYTNVSKFAAAFRAATGMCPYQYRRADCPSAACICQSDETDCIAWPVQS